MNIYKYIFQNDEINPKNEKSSKAFNKDVENLIRKESFKKKLTSSISCCYKNCFSKTLENAESFFLPIAELYFSISSSRRLCSYMTSRC